MSDDPYEWTIIDKAKLMQGDLVATATQDSAPDGFDYEATRLEFLRDPTIKSLLPEYIGRCRDLGQFWQFIKYEFRTYAERRKFIWDSFTPLMDHLEKCSKIPSDTIIGDTLQNFDSESVHAAWQKALQRRAEDPEGAITAARTLLETVCKHILDDQDVDYPANVDLPRLWALVSESLNLAPSQHSEKVFRTILGNCQSVVNSIAGIRNQISDAHGQGRRPVRPKPRHAELAVNLAGSMASFLVATFQDRVSD